MKIEYYSGRRAGDRVYRVFADGLTLGLIKRKKKKKKEKKRKKKKKKETQKKKITFHEGLARG
jgi:mRNA degradation ribonuclease J1/J2